MARESSTPRINVESSRDHETTEKVIITRTLVTGFGPFPGVEDNPSGVLARSMDRSHEIIDVSYRSARYFLERLDPSTFDRLLLLGVASGSTKCRIELFARNLIGTTPDIHGEAPGPREIYPDAPRVLGGTLWDGTKLLKSEQLADHPLLMHSFSAGTYLCNFVYYEALMRFRDKKVGFIHVPLEQDMPLEQQIAAIREVIEHIEAEPEAKPTPPSAVS